MTSLLAAGLALANAPLVRRFEAALRDPRRAQAEALSRILHETSLTGYGRRHGLRPLLLPADPYPAFRDAFPVADFRALAPWLERQRLDEAGSLCPGRVLAYEPTSGSTGARKLIPYNAALKRSFDVLFRLWSADLLRRGPPLASLRTFISMSPGGCGEKATPRGVPIGFPDDRSYLAPLTRLLASRFFVAADGLKRLPREEDFLRELSLILLREERLGILSVWSPTYLLSALDHIEAHASDLRRELARTSPRRAALLAGPGIPWDRLWPDLRLLSCWTAGQAATSARELARRLPGVTMQGKGLLATEGPVTLPWIEAGGCLPLLTEVFLEFEDGNGRIRRLHELEAGGEYGVLLTQGAGLLRYRLGDRIRAGARFRETPTLEFLGRAGEVSDLAGEKLDAAAWIGAMDALPLRGEWLALPLHNNGGSGYVLLMEDGGIDPDGIARAAEEALLAHHHYRQCRRMGQLRPVRAEHRGDLRRLYRGHCLDRGLRPGDAKPRILIADPREAADFYRRARSVSHTLKSEVPPC